MNSYTYLVKGAQSLQDVSIFSIFGTNQTITTNHNLYFLYNSIVTS